MTTSNPLFSYESHVDPRPVRAHTLVVTMGSFVDAGHIQRLVNDQVTDRLENHRLGHFDADTLVDYRGNRPPIVFAHDHFTRYEAPELTLVQATDAKGTPFLLLTGPEPDFRWEEMAAAIERIIDDHEVRLTVMVQGVPMPTPHTRPVHVTQWASRPELIPDNRPMFGTIAMSAAFPAMLAVRLGEAGHDVIGLSAGIPQYLAPGDYPDGAIAAIHALGSVSELALPTAGLELVSGAVRAEIDKQVEQSEEAREMVAELEANYDRFTARHPLLPAADAADLPTADEIAAEAEKFLRSLDEPPEE
ncbi:PAC2 family protein [Raineyella antarctica]|uniref:PAC2 family protein n=1 Tax=Raineyella antarctica TaxID=1577474 RepID=A0A1G6GMF1_9ACTN|nr:PAC2 family protein [Raineyella antarctica]SDB83192.1 PAC2 family protein [Raineyella antarctica]